MTPLVIDPEVDPGLESDGDPTLLVQVDPQIEADLVVIEVILTVTTVITVVGQDGDQRGRQALTLTRWLPKDVLVGINTLLLITVIVDLEAEVAQGEAGAEGGLAVGAVVEVRGEVAARPVTAGNAAAVIVGTGVRVFEAILVKAHVGEIV